MWAATRAAASRHGLASFCSSAPAAPSVLAVGLGNIGAPLAGRIARGGFPTSAFDMDGAATARHAEQWGSVAVEAGGDTGSALAAAAASADVIFTCLPNTDATRAVLDTIQRLTCRLGSCAG